MLLLCALIAGMSSAWGEDILTLDCATPAPTGSTSTSMDATAIATFLNDAAGLSSATNKIACSASSGNVYKGKGSGGGNIPQQCLKVGKASGGGSFTFTIPDTYDNVGSVEITCYGWSTSSSISINSGTAQTFTTAQSETTKTFELATATRTITIAVTSSAVCITEIVLKSAVTGEATTVTIDASGITNTDVASGTAAGSLSAVVKDASSNNIANASVTWASSKPSVATIDASTGAVTLVKKGSTTITASYAGVDGTYQPSSNTYELTVTNSNAGEGTASKPFSVTEARDALDNNEIDAETEYYVKGYIAKIGTFNNETGQLTYWLSDDGSMTNNVQCYKGKNVGGAAFTAETDLEVGDIATVKGKLKTYQTTTYELDENNEVVSITPRTKVNIATFTATTTTLVLGGTTTTETTVTNDQSGWTPVSYSYESDNTAVATVNASGVITAVAKGTANITVTPVVSATDPTYKVGYSKSIEITVQNPSHTATFSVNGTTSESSVEEGEAIVFPADPADFGGKKFVGWAEATIDGTTNTAPTFVTSATMGDANVTYYAVFASGTEVPGWKKLAASEVTEEGTYALLTTDGHAFNGTITNGGHGDVTTTAFSFTNNVATSAPDGTCEITLQAVTGGYKMYNADNGYLYASAASSGSLNWHSTENSYWKYANENWVYNSNNARLRGYNNNSFRTYSSNNGAVLVFAQKTTIASYSEYCTSIPTTVTKDVTSFGWASYVAPYDVEFPAGRAYVVTAAEVGSAITKAEVTQVPAGTPVLLKDEGTVTATVLATTPAAPATNMLSVCDGTIAAGKYAYVLAKKDKTNNIAGFMQWTGDAADLTNRVVMLLDEAAEAPSFIPLDGETTGINTVNGSGFMVNGSEVYNLNGQRVAQPTKGLYIVNGRKVVIK